MAMTNDELIKFRSRMYRGFRAPMAVTEFLNKSAILSITHDANGNVQEIVEQLVLPGGESMTKTTVFTLDPDGQIISSTVTYTSD